MTNTSTINWDAPIASFDTETTGFKPQEGCRPFIYGMALDDGEIIIGRRGSKNHKRIVDILEDPSIAKTAHNIKFDHRHIWYDGVDLQGDLHDTIIMAATVNEYEQSFKLEKLAQKHLGFVPTNADMVQNWLAANRADIKQRFGREPRYSDIPDQIIVPYLEDDVVNGLKLFFLYKNFIKQHFDDLYCWEMRLVPALMRMETRGIQLDLDYIAEQRNKLERASVEALGRLHEITNNINFNPNSPKQVAYYVKKFNFKLDRKDYNKAGQPKTGKKVLDKYHSKKDADGNVIFEGHPFVDGLIEYRRVTKLKGTYFDALMRYELGGIVHANLWQGVSSGDSGIRTQRLSASEPNLHSVPARDATTVRKAFKPREGCVMVYLDYSQVEMLVFCDLFKPASMIEAYERGEDFHSFTGRLLAGYELSEWTNMANADETTTAYKTWKRLRQIGKSCNFAIIFGTGIQTFSDTAGLSYNEGKKKFDQYKDFFPEIDDIMTEQMRSLHVRGYVEDRSGRRYHVPSNLAYKAVNAVVQGEAANIMKRGIVKADNFLMQWRQAEERMKLWQQQHKIPPGLCLTIHDELHLESLPEHVDELAPQVANAMERTDFVLPIKVDCEFTTTTWAEKWNWDLSKPFKSVLRKQR